ncbi:NDR1/HIN1-like protein 2 [Oryza brachyantha]|uniref:Late embryogenesis abundant protein LEA-2 subgroup domain-containing protein n=1 Tax=Oryza brachyantha TaxID=4533 RepID=J3M2U4_ORYBR|nr:NDR1/HIN1-like protein 2 [Oryza brachyantha]
MGSASRAVSCLCCPCKCLACGLFSCLCSILISLLVTVGVLALIFYLIFRPHMIAATVDSASLVQFTLAQNSALAYNLNVDLTVRNPNKRVGLYYDNVESLALFDGQRFGYAPLDPFFQSTEASTKLSPSFKGQQPLTGDITAANFRSQQTSGKFDIEVKLNAKLRVKVWAFKVPGPKAKISCPITVPVPNSNSAAFQPTDCKVWF